MGKENRGVKSGEETEEGGSGRVDKEERCGRRSKGGKVTREERRKRKDERSEGSGGGIS